MKIPFGKKELVLIIKDLELFKKMYDETFTHCGKQYYIRHLDAFITKFKRYKTKRRYFAKINKKKSRSKIYEN